ncbi:prolyl 4-hydroxylase subunit alpha-1-like [Amphibalanus amphitrite]|uniref:prolyl 4-hydroxylase subunit alpha-1-like n=1 Tax=Amphibalanus amphitrite TaxID=1232801 RepID=UPI001C915942|nr:prolyl 4-hydroxylase subunit alpha-1-like [Amphibalanus amphitrite]
MDACPSFLRSLSALLVISFLSSLVLQPLIPSVRAEALSELTASALELDRLFQAEQNIVKELEKFVQLSESKLELAKRYLETYREHNPMLQPSNPVRDYKLMQRVESLWTEELYTPDLLETLTSVQRRVEEFTNSETGTRPGTEEALETLRAMVEVQSVYDLDVTDLAEGRLMGLDTGTKMSVDDLLKLAGVMCASNAVDKCLVWLEGALQVAMARNLTDWVNDIRPSYTDMIKRHDKRLSQGGTPGMQLFPYPVGDGSPRAMQRELEEHITLADKAAAINKLCRGTELRDASQLSKLYCKYERPHPYLFMQPLKTEVQNIDPYLCIYHDVLRKSEIDQLIVTARPHMERSMVGIGHDSWTGRVSSSSRLEDTDHPVVMTLNRRIEMATGLDVTNRTGYEQEMLQVCEYGTGGQFSAHHDYLNLADEAILQSFIDNEDDAYITGERIATIMFYLNPVLRGGRTVFPYLGVSVEPEQGSAVYWDNVLPDGTADERTLHSGCPVAYGYKWIANKFIRELSQTFRRPCREV